MSKPSEICFAYITAPDREIARSLGRQLVEKRLAACVNVLGTIDSIYHWDGKIEEAQNGYQKGGYTKSDFPAFSDRILY